VGAGGLTLPSVALLDQVRALDVRRVQRFLGSLSPAQYEPIGRGLAAAFAHPR
jgi:mRNA interferase MazF